MPQSLNDPDVHEPARAWLFMVRIWREELGSGRFEWRGKVQHIMSGEVHYFRDWETLITELQEMLKISER